MFLLLLVHHPGPDPSGFCALDRGRDECHPFDPIIDRRKIAIMRDTLAVNFRFYSARCLDINIRKSLNKSLRVTRWQASEPFCDVTDIFIAAPIGASWFVGILDD